MIATTLQQSKKLIELGIDPKTADMSWCNSSIRGVNYTDEYHLEPKTIKEIKEIFDSIHPTWQTYWEIHPAWSLDALLKLIPDYITHDSILCTFMMTKYGVGYSDTTSDKFSICWYESPSLIDSVYECVKWLLEHNYIKKE